MESDNEVSGTGNSFTTEFRQYDPRLGRWKSCDGMRHWYPSMSAYAYASNMPTVGKDDNGLYTIFVNGYIYGKPDICDPNSGTVISDDIAPLKPYWSGDGNNFIKAAHRYFGDGIGKYVNGSGLWAGSTAAGRQRRGREQGKKMAAEIIAEINRLNSDLDEHGNLNTANDVTEINFVTHSMGAAFAEGMIEEFMKHEELKKLLEKGQIIHFSACDGDAIKISSNSTHLQRTQLNIRHDLTLSIADPGSVSASQMTYGYYIKGVNKFGLINEYVNTLHEKRISDPSSYDAHYDTKTYSWVWEYIRALDKSPNSGSSSQPVNLYKSDIEDTPTGEKTNTSNKG